jgi:anaerobic magnesium-protoporphyrin IX monomethyl ester cyclase
MFIVSQMFLKNSRGGSKMKIQLISAPTDDDRAVLYENKAYVPFGLTCIATYLENHGHDVEIIDGQHISIGEIIEMINAPFVGVTFNILSTDSLDAIASSAKKKGATVIVGGQAATPLAKNLLTNGNIDYVVRFAGEEALNCLMIGCDISQVPGLVYRQGDLIVENSASQLILASLPLPRWEFKGINVGLYWKRFAEIKGSVKHNHRHNKPLNTFVHRGCPMRVKGGGCSFCSRVDLVLQSRTPVQAHDEYSYLVSLGADRLEDFSDSYLHNLNWLKELAKLVTQKGHWGAPVRVYADTRHINEETVCVMKELHIDSVILGVESGDEEILRQNFKPNTLKQILGAIDLLAKNEIRTCPSFVLGLIGESQVSAERTFQLAREIANRSELEMSYFNLMTPYPGSKAWKLLLNYPEMQGYANSYHLSMSRLQQEFIERFTSLGADGRKFLFQRIQEEAEKIGLAQCEEIGR